MTGNVDKAKVIAGLRCCIVRNPDDKMRCTECPYRDPGTYCLNRLKIDALAVLEAEEEEKAECEACMIHFDDEQEGSENEREEG